MPIIDINARFGSYPSRYKSTSVDDLSIDVKSHGVAKACVSSTTGSFFNDAEGNSETLEACGRYPGQLLPVGTLNPKMCVDPAKSVETLVKNGFKVVRFFPHEQGWPIDFSPLAELLTAIDAAKLTTIISCPESGDVTALARMIKANMTSGRSRVILASITSDTFAEAVSSMRSNESLMIETHSLRFPDGLTLLRDNVGVDRVLFGSGASAQSIGAALQYVTGSQLSEGDQSKVLGDNAAATLGLN